MSKTFRDGEAVKVTVYIPIELDTELRVEAARNRTTRTEIATKALEAYLRPNKRKKAASTQSEAA